MARRTLVPASRCSAPSLVIALGLMLASSTARADVPSSGDTEAAREAFRQGASLAKDTQWGAALAAFERSAKLRPSAGTTYNIAVCARALGQYVRARKTFLAALSERRSDTDLAEETVLDVKRFVGEIDRIIAAIDVSLTPADAAIAIDGQPLETDVSAAGGPPTLLAGTLPAGPGKAPPAGAFRVIVDPGTHVVLVSRDGFGDAVKTVTVRPGEKTQLDLTVARLPATLAVNADRKDAVVTVNALDVGVAPIELSRPAGKYRVAVKHAGFVPYEVDAALAPGQKTELFARLEPEKPSILGRWWFWTAAGIVVAGAAVTTYLIARPDPERPPVDGGGLGWTARVP